MKPTQRESEVGFTSFNRKPNIMYIHDSLTKSVATNGYDALRPRVGVAIHFESEAGRARLREDTSPPSPPPAKR